MQQFNPNEVLREVQKYFSPGEYEFELFLLLLFPLILLAATAVYFNRANKGTFNLEEVLSEKDFEFIEMVRQTKKLEDFDRDFLIELALKSEIFPIYLIFIDKDAFLKAEADLISEIPSEKTTQNYRLQLLKKLKKQLF